MGRRRWRGRCGRALAAAGAVAGLVLVTAGSAQAASTPVTGEVNCNGTKVYYSTERRTTSTGPTELNLTNSAGSPWGGWQPTIGVRITATGGEHSHFFSYGAPSWGTLIPSGTYIVNTRFTMWARMQVSSGACDNVWGGTLYY